MSLIDNYQAVKDKIGLIAPNGEPLNSFFASRERLEAILADPSFTGVRIHLAKEANTPLRQITLAFTGSTLVIPAPTGVTAFDTTGDPLPPPPCPTVCN